MDGSANMWSILEFYDTINEFLSSWMGLSIENIFRSNFFVWKKQYVFSELGSGYHTNAEFK